MYKNKINFILGFFFSTNILFLKKTKKNIIKYYSIHNNSSIEFELDDKVLIVSKNTVKRNKKDNFVIIDKNKVKNKKILYIICGEIVNIHKAGVYDILISWDYIDYNLKK